MAQIVYMVMGSDIVTLILMYKYLIIVTVYVFVYCSCVLAL